MQDYRKVQYSDDVHAVLNFKNLSQLKFCSDRPTPPPHVRGWFPVNKFRLVGASGWLFIDFACSFLNKLTSEKREYLRNVCYSRFLLKFD